MSNTKQLPFGRYVDGVIVRSWNDLERKIGSATIPIVQIVIKLDDESLPDNVNGREISSMIRLDPKAKVLLQFCGFLDCRGILEFKEAHRKKSKAGGYAAASDHLIENIDEVTGVWDEENRVLNGGKLVGHRLSFIISKMVSWNGDSSRFPNNLRLEVHHPKYKDRNPVVFNIFEISHLDEEVIKGDKFVELGQTTDIHEVEPDDDVRWSSRKEDKARKKDLEEEPF